ncbi:MAG: Sir2 family NAD-dependent protein deacetylase [Chloroflexota bacterium]|nr:Sir2 family NAD-dependent protein deacetylase [Chloroflexota bacterium]
MSVIPTAADPTLALAHLLHSCERVLLFTGAGASTEAGIPDYQSPGGVWSRYRNVTCTEFLEDPALRRVFWERGRELYPPIYSAHPNPAHYLAPWLLAEGRLAGVVTQNVDGLHQATGLPLEWLVELHGNAHRVRCLGCSWGCARQEVQQRLEAGDLTPECPGCGGILKPTTVAFGEPLPPEQTERARQMASGCDLCLVIGSALKVYPAAYVPHWARKAGACLAILNLEPTRLDDLCEVVVHARAGATLRRILEPLSKHEQRQGQVWP